MTKTAPKHAVSYLRVSGLGQVDGDGFQRQRESVQERARALGLEVVGEFQDAGMSGTASLQDRPGLAALVEHGTVLIEKADRLARDLIEGELILRELRSAGVRVIEAEGGTDLTEGDGNPTATLIRQVLGAVAEFEKSALVQKLAAARKRARKARGRCEGPPPFGQLPGEEAALQDLLLLARRVRGKRLSAAEIARRMDELEHRPRRSEKWSRSSVSAILRRVRRK